MSLSRRTVLVPTDVDPFRPAGTLVIGPWVIWSSKPKPQRRARRRGTAKQLSLDLELSGFALDAGKAE